jgi:hypothetical protein
VAHEALSAFFSYSRADGEFALKLAKDLRAAGANVWIDQLDIDPGTSWDRAVEDALKRSPRILVILSPTAVGSNNVSDEISFALSKQKLVIPVLYRECELPLRLARLQHIDFRADYAHGLKALSRALGTKQMPPVPPPPKPTRRYRRWMRVGIAFPAILLAIWLVSQLRSPSPSSSPSSSSPSPSPSNEKAREGAPRANTTPARPPERH